MHVLSMRKFGPAREKEETWPFSSQCNLKILQNELLHCQPSPSLSIGGQFFAKFKSFVPQYLRPPY